MNLKKNLKIKTILLSAVLFSQTALSGVNASDTPPMYDISPSPPTVSGSSEHTTDQSSKKRQRKEDEGQSSEKSEKAVKKQPPKKTEGVSEAVFLNNSFPVDLPVMFAYPAEPPSDLLYNCQQENSTRLNPDYIDAAFDPQSPLNILPNFSQESVSTEATQKRLSRKDITPRCSREETQPDEGQEEPTPETDSTAEKLLDIIYVPEAQRYCHVLVVNINSNFKSELSDEEFSALAERDLREWAGLCHDVCKEATVTDCLANIEMVLCHNKVLEPVKKVLGMRGWLTTDCKFLGPGSTLELETATKPRRKHEPFYLDCTELAISHRGRRLTTKEYDMSLLRAALRFFVDCSICLHMGNLINHPVFNDEELINEIYKISVLCASDCNGIYIINYFRRKEISKKISKKIESYRFGGLGFEEKETLDAMKNFFKYANEGKDEQGELPYEDVFFNLVHGIKYFHLARALKILPFTKTPPRRKGQFEPLIKKTDF